MGTFGSLVVAAVVATAALILYQPPGITWLEPFDLIFAWPTLIGGVTLACYFQQWRWLVNPIWLSALVLAFVNHRTPWLMQVIMTAATLGFLVYAYGRHWSVVVTTAPVARDVADKYRAQCSEILIGIAGTISILVAGLLWTRWPLLMLAMGVLPLIPLLIPKPKELKSSVSSVIRTSILSWFTFEAQPLPGLVQSPIGRAPERRALSLVCGVLVMLALGRTTISPARAVIEFARSQDIAVMPGTATNTRESRRSFGRRCSTSTTIFTTTYGATTTKRSTANKLSQSLTPFEFWTAGLILQSKKAGWIERRR